MAIARKRQPLWQVEEILYENLLDKPTSWESLGLSGTFPFVNYDAVQELTDDQKLQARENIGATGTSHDPLTLGESKNGLSLAGQVLSNALATNDASGAMSSADKLKMTGGDILVSDGVSATGTLTGRLLSEGDVTFKVDATVLRVSGDQTILGLKSTRRFGANDGSTAQIVKRYEVDSANLYKLDLVNTQNVQSATGEVQWFYSYTSNTGAGSPKSRDMIGFTRGGITVFGGRRLPTTYYDTVVTDEGSNTGTPSYRYPMRQYSYGISQFETGIIVGTDAIRVSKITGDTKLFVEGAIRTTSPDDGTEASIFMGEYTVTADGASDIRWRVKVGDKVIDLLGVEVS